MVTAVGPLGSVKRQRDGTELARRDITLADQRRARFSPSTPSACPLTFAWHSSGWNVHVRTCAVHASILLPDCSKLFNPTLIMKSKAHSVLLVRPLKIAWRNAGTSVPYMCCALHQFHYPT